jgi:blue copper oxidase
MITRRGFVVGAGAASAMLLSSEPGHSELTPAVARLPIPQLIDAEKQGNIVTLKASAGQHAFYKGKPTRAYGYSAPILGPVLRLRRGDDVKMIVHNALEAATTVHWHGLLVPGDADGGPQRLIEPGATWQPTLSIDQGAATLWYHPHPHHDTGRQIYLGLAGLIIVEDGIDLALPHEFGIDDLPLIIQDRVVDDADGSIDYDSGDELAVIYGARGDTVIVNGAITPTARVPAGWVRLRLLNAANARNFELRFRDKRRFYVIASDGGFLARPVPMSELRISPAERFELLVDFSNGQPVVLETGPDRVMGIFGIISESDTNGYVPVMRFSVGPARSSSALLPSHLIDPAALDPNAAVQRRQFVLNNGVCGQRTRMSEHPDMPALIGINGQVHDPKRIDVETKLGTSEIWEIVSVGMPHPFHIHGAMFRIMSLNGKPRPEHLAGWKDVVLVEDKAELLVRFTRPASADYPFMYHCHILEHEDAGMMGQYTCT